LGAVPQDPYSIQLSWTDNAANQSAVLLERSTDGTNFSQIASLAGTANNYTDTGLTTGTRYYYRVRASNSAGTSSYSNVTNAVGPAAPAPPAAPSGLSATAPAYGQINLSWTDNSTNESAFLIERSTDGTNFSQVASVAANATSYSDTGLSPSTLYYYRVRATNNGSNSGYSNAASATTQAVGTGPFSLFTSSVVPASVDDPDTSSNEVGVKFYTDVPGTISSILFYKGSANTGTHTAHLWTASGTLLASATFTSETASGWQQVTFSSPVSIQANTVYVASYFAPKGRYAEDDDYFTSTGVDSGPLHAPQAGVDGFNGVYVQSATSAFPNQNFLSANYYVDVVFTPTGQSVPAAPSNLTATAASATQINLSWTDNSTNETAFLVERSTDGVNFTQIASLAAGTASYSDTGLASGTHYTYRVRASNAAGNSAYSNTAAATTIALLTAPVAPTGLSATAASPSTVNLAWSNVATNATGIEIDRQTGSGAYVAVTVVSPGTSTFTDAGLAEGTAYSYRVFATNSVGNSAYSNTVSAQTPVLAVTSESPAQGSVNLPLSTVVTATFNESVQSSSIQFVLRDPSGSIVPATITYNDATHTATLTPAAQLGIDTTYTATVSGAMDAANNALAAPVTWSFMSDAPSVTWQQNTAAAFGAGATVGTVVTLNGVQLAPAFFDDFTGTALGSQWMASSWSSGSGTAAVTELGGILNVGREQVRSAQTFTSGSVEGLIAFGAAAQQQFGLATNLSTASGNYYAVFTTRGTTTTLYALVNANGSTSYTKIGTLPVGYHDYLVKPTSTGFQFYKDGTLKATIKKTFKAGIAWHVALSAQKGAPATLLKADWVRVNGYASQGTFVSSVLDTGTTATWGTLTWTANLPAGTSLVVETSSGNTATPDSTWSAWSAVTNGGTVTSPAARYIRYRLTLVTTSATATPSVTGVSLQWS